MGISIEEVDTRVAPEALLREMHHHHLEWDAELLPEDPPQPFRQRLGEWRHVVETDLVPWWVLREHGEIAGMATAIVHQQDDLDNGFVLMHVSSDRRRRGLGRRLAGPLLAFLEANDRKSVITDVPAGSPWEPKLADIGLRKALQDKRSRLRIADLDWELMDRWVERAARRAAGYDLLFIASPVPEEHLERWCRVQYVMHTAPTEDLEFDFHDWTPEKWREAERRDELAGTRMLAHVAVDRETGDFVGFSNLYVQDHQRDLAWQANTGVDPAHRNQGLGRWLKAATIRRVVEEHPEVERVDTYNAGSNKAMLDINVEMGYRPILVSHAWQGEVATVRERLGV